MSSHKGCSTVEHHKVSTADEKLDKILKNLMVLDEKVLSVSNKQTTMEEQLDSNSESIRVLNEKIDSTMIT